MWENTETTIRVKCGNCGNSIDTRDRKEDNKKRVRKEADKFKYTKGEASNKAAIKSRAKARMFALTKVGKGILKCSNCKCDNHNLLEINHINGGGRKEGLFGKKMVDAIISGRRDTDDLNLLCRVCNTLHYVELKYGKLPYKILWSGTL